MRILRFLPGLATLAILAFVVSADAQDKKPIAEKHDASALSKSLRDVINTGADLFNLHGDYAGCYRVYQGGLLSVKPFLTTEMRNKIDQAIAKAEKLPRFSDRAFELRTVIDEIRDQSKGEKGPAPKKEEMKGGSPKQEEKKTPVIDPNMGQVKGKVLYNGKPAPPGFITLAGKQRFSASITDDGSYKFNTPIPPGTYKIAIERVPGAQIPPALDIPERFRAEATSGLTYEVKAGKVSLDLNLSK